MKTDPQQRELVEACKKGNRRAQQELYSRYARAMYNICLRMAKHEADAEDLLQNAFIDVFTKLDSFRYESTVGAWIKRIVINTCINFLKKRRLDTTSWDERIPEPSMGSDTNEWADRIPIDRVKRAIADLPDGYRTVFSLYLMEGYDHKEIGEILDISEATSKSQYSRAKSRLRQIILDTN